MPPVGYVAVNGDDMIVLEDSQYPIEDPYDDINPRNTHSNPHSQLSKSPFHFINCLVSVDTVCLLRGVDQIILFYRLPHRKNIRI